MLTTQPLFGQLRADNVVRFVVNYTCEVCLEPVPIEWTVRNWEDPNNPELQSPKVVIPIREEFSFEFVPDAVKKEIEEALDCLSVAAFNGFAAVCRRATQAICTNLGAKARSKVENQIREMIELTRLGEDWKELAIQIMLSGHDGSHPHLPDVDEERAAILLSLLKDLTHQLYTRPGKIKEAAKLRKTAIEKKISDERAS